MEQDHVEGLAQRASGKVRTFRAEGPFTSLARFIGCALAVAGPMSAVACGASDPPSHESSDPSFASTIDAGTVERDAASTRADASPGVIPVDAGPMLTISADTTWNDGMQFCESVLIARGVTVTVAPGSTIRFARGATLIVAGKLSGMSGTSATPIVLTSRSASALWGGLVVLEEGVADFAWASLDNMTDLFVYGLVTTNNFSAQAVSSALFQPGSWESTGDTTITVPTIPDAGPQADAQSSEDDAQGWRVSAGGGCD